jgi:hypothetical protein
LTVAGITTKQDATAQQKAVINTLPPDECEKINIYHAGYPDDDDPLLVLEGYDSKSGAIDKAIVMAICGIIADNDFDCCLSASSNPPPTPIQEQKLVEPGNYWLHSSRQSGKP